MEGEENMSKRSQGPRTDVMLFEFEEFYIALEAYAEGLSEVISSHENE